MSNSQCPVCSEKVGRRTRKVQMHFQERHGLRISHGEAFQLLTTTKRARDDLKKHLSERIAAFEAPVAERTSPNATATRDSERPRRLLLAADEVTASFRAPSRALFLKAVEERRDDLERLIRKKWLDLKTAQRHFGLDPDREYRVEVGIRVLREIGIGYLGF